MVDQTSVGPCEANGYRGARYLRDTPYKTVTEWGRAIIAAIPEAERCGKCKGSGEDVILASNGGVGEVVRCGWCEGSGRKSRAAALDEKQGGTKDDA